MFDEKNRPLVNTFLIIFLAGSIISAYIFIHEIGDGIADIQSRLESVESNHKDIKQ